MNTNSLLERLHQLTATLIGLLLVVPRQAWSVTRHAITIIHEGGHSLVSMVMGERSQRIHLNRDTSGYTQYAAVQNRPWRLVRAVSTASAGYPAACVLGLAMALLLVAGHAAASLWLLLLCLVGVLVQVRNLWGWFSVLATLVLLAITTWFLPDQYQTVLATLVMSFLLCGGWRTGVEQRVTVRHLQRTRQQDTTDARVMAKLLHVPVGVTVWYFLVFNSVCVGLSYALLLNGGKWL